jgi:hypothetical protein
MKCTARVLQRQILIVCSTFAKGIVYDFVFAKGIDLLKLKIYHGIRKN